MRSGSWQFAAARSNDASKSYNIGAQQQSLRLFWKTYFLYDFRCAQTCSFRAVLGLPYLYEVWQLLSALYNVMRKKFYI